MKGWGRAGTFPGPSQEEQERFGEVSILPESKCVWLAWFALEQMPS